ncbi:MAG: nicotinate phosphoribosyltransferase [bacterium]|nr:nicotinate phosphoribosyltransferase [bacterium]
MARKASPDRPFFVASPEEIIAGRTTDVYFERTLRVLGAEGIDRKVVAEVRAKALPRRIPWAVFAGLEEALRLLERLRIDVGVRAVDEGTVFGAGDVVFSIAGRYNLFGAYETPLLGLLCQASGIATAAARCRKAAGNRAILSFGARRMHPAIAPMIDRSAYIGGADGVSAVASAKRLGLEPSGTMPHALVLCVGDTVEATRAFRRIIGRKAPCVSLIDTFNDEKVEALRVARALGSGLAAVRLDTPASRRGSMADILREVRWELDLNGFRRVKLFVSGGLDEEKIPGLNPWADGYGVGTRIASAPVVDFALDIVEIDDRPVAKRGKEAGEKKLCRCRRCGARVNVPVRARPPRCACGGATADIHRTFMRGGRIALKLPAPREIRARTLAGLRRVAL